MAKEQIYLPMVTSIRDSIRTVSLRELVSTPGLTVTTMKEISKQGLRKAKASGKSS